MQNGTINRVEEYMADNKQKPC